MSMRKPRRWIENFRQVLRTDRSHLHAIQEMGFEEYAKLELVELTDKELGRLLADAVHITGYIKVPALPKTEPYWQ